MWLRTGIMYDGTHPAADSGVKFNPNDDPATGRFTTGDGGSGGTEQTGRVGLGKPEALGAAIADAPVPRVGVPATSSGAGGRAPSIARPDHPHGVLTRVHPK